MQTKIIRLHEIDSTNRYLMEECDACDDQIIVATAEYQSAGKGMGTNSWESEPKKNLLFSILVHPNRLPIARQFMLSMTEALALHDVLIQFSDEIRIKWPNDIYWRDKKLSGTRIDTTLSQKGIRKFVIGTGVNVNQILFKSDAPNPVSLAQIVERELDCDALLQQIVEAFAQRYEMLYNGAYAQLSADYHANLYRSHGFFLYRTADGEMQAALIEVEDDGTLVLRDERGVISSYHFKEIEYII